MHGALGLKESPGLCLLILLLLIVLCVYVFSHYSLSLLRTQRRGEFLCTHLCQQCLFKKGEVLNCALLEQMAFSFALKPCSLYSVSRKCAGAVCVMGNNVLASAFFFYRDGGFLRTTLICCIFLIISSLLFSLFSSAMKRLPYSEEEFGSAPNKLARMDEPKKGVF